LTPLVPEKAKWLDVLDEDLIAELSQKEGHSSEAQIGRDGHMANNGDIGSHPCPSVVQARTLHTEIDTNQKGIRNRALERFSMSRNRKDGLVDLHDLMPCWLTHEWRAA
jgi:hypothetical protein